MNGLLQEALMASSLFADTSARSLAWHEEDLPEGGELSDVWQDLPCVCLILSGRVNAFAVAIDGKDTLLNTLGPGDCFGVSNLTSGEKLPTRLVCAEPVRAAFAEKAELLRAMETDSALAMRYVRLLNGKLSLLIQRIEMLTAQSCRGRLIACLLLHRSEDGTVNLGCTREELASRIGMSRAALFRELGALGKAGVLLTKGSRIIVPDAEALEGFLRLNESPV